MNEEDIIKAQKQELDNLIKEHKLSCIVCSDSYSCDQTMCILWEQIVNDYMADQEQQGN